MCHRIRPYWQALLRHLLYNSWRNSLSRSDRVRLEHWGATGNAKHHLWAWTGLEP